MNARFARIFSIVFVFALGLATALLVQYKHNSRLQLQTLAIPSSEPGEGARGATGASGPTAAPTTPSPPPTAASEPEKPKTAGFVLPPTEPPALTDYKGRIIAATMHWKGAAWLQRASREEEERGSVMRKQLEIKPGMTVCDLGSGDGYHTLWMSEEVGASGSVYAVDVQPEMLQFLQKRLDEKKITNVKPIVGKYWDPNLPDNSQDLILLVDVYHEFSHPEHMLKAMWKAIKPHGRLVLVEFRSEDPKVPIKPEHKMSKAQMALEIPPMGFKLVKEFDELPWQHLMFYEKTEAKTEAKP